MRNRMRNLIRLTAPALIAGAVLLLLAALGLGVPCLFFAVTGLYCPGCGVSRMLLSLLRLDFSAAFRYNPAVMTALPFLAVLFLSMGIRYVRTGKLSPTKPQTALLWTMAAGLLLFGALRNLPAFPMLRPPAL